MSSRQDFDIAIIGAGPVGTYLANLLGMAGLHVLLLDREFDIYQLPRAVHFDGEVMRAFQSAGLADTVAKIARASSKGMHFVSASGQTLLVRRAYDGVGPHDWASNYYVHQPHLEAVLRDGLRRFPSTRNTLRPRGGRLGRGDLWRDVVDSRSENWKEFNGSRQLCRRMRRRPLARAPRHGVDKRRSRPASAVACRRCDPQTGFGARSCLAGIYRSALRSGAPDDGRLGQRQSAPVGDHADARR